MCNLGEGIWECGVEKGIVGRLDNSGCLLYNETNAGKGTSSNDFYDSQMSEESTAYREQPAGERRTYRSCEYIPEHRTEILCQRIWQESRLRRGRPLSCRSIGCRSCTP